MLDVRGSRFEVVVGVLLQFHFTGGHFVHFRGTPSIGGFWAATFFAYFEFAMELSHHAAGGAEEDNVGDAVDDACAFPERRVDEGEDVADATQELEAVVEAYEAVIAGIGLDRVHVHGQEPRRRDDHARTDAGLEAEAAGGAGLLAAVAGVPEAAAALGNIALRANVILEAGPGRLGIQYALAHGIIRA